MPGVRNRGSLRTPPKSGSSSKDRSAKKTQPSKGSPSTKGTPSKVSAAESRNKRNTKDDKTPSRARSSRRNSSSQRTPSTSPVARNKKPSTPASTSRSSRSRADSPRVSEPSKRSQRNKSSPVPPEKKSNKDNDTKAKGKSTERVNSKDTKASEKPKDNEQSRTSRRLSLKGSNDKKEDTKGSNDKKEDTKGSNDNKKDTKGSNDKKEDSKPKTNNKNAKPLIDDDLFTSEGSSDDEKGKNTKQNKNTTSNAKNSKVNSRRKSNGNNVVEISSGEEEEDVEISSGDEGDSSDAYAVSSDFDVIEAEEISSSDEEVGEVIIQESKGKSGQLSRLEDRINVLSKLLSESKEKFKKQLEKRDSELSMVSDTLRQRNDALSRYEKELSWKESQLDKMSDVVSRNSELEAQLVQMDKELKATKASTSKPTAPQFKVINMTKQQIESLNINKPMFAPNTSGITFPHPLAGASILRAVPKPIEITPTTMMRPIEVAPLDLPLQIRTHEQRSSASASVDLSIPASTPVTVKEEDKDSDKDSGKGKKNKSQESSDEEGEDMDTAEDSDSESEDEEEEVTTKTKAKKKVENSPRRSTRGRKEESEKESESEEEEETTTRKSKRQLEKTPRKSTRGKKGESEDEEVVAKKKSKSDNDTSTRRSSRRNRKEEESEDEEEEKSEEDKSPTRRSARKRKGDNEDKGKAEKGKGKKKRGRKKKPEEKTEDIDCLFVSSDSDVEIVEPEKKKKKKDKKSKDKDEEEDKEDNDEEKDGEDSPNKKGRHDIRKLKKKLADETIAAAKAEKERAERAEAERKKHLIESKKDPNSKIPIYTKIVLAFKEGAKKPTPQVEVNQSLVKKLKPHQVEAVEFLWDNVVESVKRIKEDKEGSGCILAHCMGLGKTLSTISLVHTMLTHSCLGIKRCLVVCPLNTILNWQNEWEKWLFKKDRLPTYEMLTSKGYHQRAAMLNEWHKKGGVMIMGYSLFRILVMYSGRSKKCKEAFDKCLLDPATKRIKETFDTCLLDPGPDIVVCDEGHILKNDSSAISKCMSRIRTKRRIVLTGTPLQNNLIEYHCMVNFVKQNLLGTSREFRNRFVNPITNGQHSDSTSRDVKVMKRRAHVLHEMLNKCVQRQDYTALCKFLPNKYEYIVKVRLSDLQVQLYKEYLRVNGLAVDEQEPGLKVAGAKLFSDYQALMRIWTHPWVLKLDEVRQEKKALMEQDDELDSFVTTDDEDEVTSDSSSPSSSDEGGAESGSGSKSGSDDDNDDSNDDEKSESSSASEEASRKTRTTRSGRNIKKKKSSDEDEEDGNTSPSKRKPSLKDILKGVGEKDKDDSKKKDSKDKKDEESKKKKKDKNEKMKKPGQWRRIKRAGSDSNESSKEETSKEGTPIDPDTRKAKVLAGEVIRKWQSKSRNGVADDGVTHSDIIRERELWWSKFVNQEDHMQKLELSGKLILMFKILQMSEALGDKVLVFSQSLLTLDIIEDFLKYKDEEAQNKKVTKRGPKPSRWVKGEDYIRMDGSTGALNRKKLTNEFNDADDTRLRLFLISTRAGGLGINLDCANRVIIFDASWNPSHDVQSIFRVYRFGQVKEVYVYRLIAQGTMEEKIYDRQVTKETLSQRVIDEHQIDRHFTANDLAELYRFKPDILGDPDCPKRPTPAIPKDTVLTELLSSEKDWIVTYHTHDSLLENRPEENLTEEERKSAWEEYEKEKQGIYTGDRLNINMGTAQGGTYRPLSYQMNYIRNAGISLQPQIGQITQVPANWKYNWSPHVNVASQYQPNRMQAQQQPAMSHSISLPNLPAIDNQPKLNFQIAQLPKVVQEILKYNPSITKEELQNRVHAFLSMHARTSNPIVKVEETIVDGKRKFAVKLQVKTSSLSTAQNTKIVPGAANKPLSLKPVIAKPVQGKPATGNPVTAVKPATTKPVPVKGSLITEKRPGLGGAEDITMETIQTIAQAASDATFKQVEALKAQKSGESSGDSSSAPLPSNATIATTSDGSLTILPSRLPSTGKLPALAPQ